MTAGKKYSKGGLNTVLWLKCGEVPARAERPGENEYKPMDKLWEPRLFFTRPCEPNLSSFTRRAARDILV